MPCYMAKVGDWTIRYGWSFFSEKLIDGDIDYHKRLDLIDLLNKNNKKTKLNKSWV